jgi:hypothetical protein
MRIAGDSITKINAKPRAGDELSASPDIETYYIVPTVELNKNATPIICISPPVVNVDDRVEYTFPTGSNTTLGRQTSGFWTKSSPTDASEYVFAAYTFDQKKAMDSVRYADRLIVYDLSDGVKNTIDVGVAITGSFVTGTSAPAASNTFPISSTKEREYRVGTSVNNWEAGGYTSRSVPTRSYEIYWGTDSPENYGPFNMSVGDLLSMEEYVFTNFLAVSDHVDDVGGYVRPLVYEGFNDAENQQEPVTMQMSASIPATSGSNVHISYAKAWMRTA